MQTLEFLKKQISAVSELEGISGALEQVAAKEILEVRKNILANREFFEETWRIYGLLRGLVQLPPEVKNKDLVFIITLNKGMCGNLMNRVIRAGEKAADKYKADILITGKKGQSVFANRDDKTVHFFNIPNEISYEQAEPLKEIASQYARVHVVFPRYLSTMKQEVQVISLVAKPEEENQPNLEKFILPKRYRIEPSLAEVVNYFNKAIVGMMIYSFFTESLLAYSAAQMVAMRSAHDNAEDMKKTAVSKYHKQRREIIDVKLRELYKFRFMVHGAGGGS